VSLLPPTVGIGSLDPFGVFAIPITSSVNRIIAFFRHSYLPLAYRNYDGVTPEVQSNMAKLEEEE
jgi:hypothetical protein